MTRENLIGIGGALLLGAAVFFAFQHPVSVPAIPNGFDALGPVTDGDFSSNRSHSVPTTTPKAATSSLPLHATQLAAAVAESPSPSTPKISIADLNATVGLVRGALVNIICVPSAPNLNAASATGIVIDPRGIILTVAHMAQYYLLADYPKRGGTYCVIRTGSPAKSAYFASLIYISPEWVQDNPSILVEKTPTGTGEDDFALLAITSSATSDPLPSSFTAIPLSDENPPLQEPVTIGSYGAEFLASSQIRSALYPIVVFGSITDRFTFHAKTEDLVAVTNTAAAQEGSSGGVLVNAHNQTVGLITTSSSGDSITARTLHAITGNYIQRVFKAETGTDLATYLQSPTDTLIQEFNDTAAGLSNYLREHVQ